MLIVMDTKTDLPPVEPKGASGPLVRPVQGRWLAGVAVGLANRLGIPPWVARLAFSLLIAGGGAGIFLYLAGWLLIPAEGESDSLGHRLARRVEGTQAWVGLGLMVVAGAIVLGMIPFVDAELLIPTLLLVVGILLYRDDLPRLFSSRSEPAGPPVGEPPLATPGSLAGPAAIVPPPRPVRPTPPPSPLGRITLGLALLANGALLITDRVTTLVEANWRHYLAITLVTLGVGLLVGSLFGRARGLILVGVILVPSLIGATIWEHTQIRSDETLTIRSFDESPLTIERSSGRLTINLTELPWSGETFEIDATMGAGEIAVLIPPSVGVDMSGEVGIGAFGGSFGGGVGGFGVEQHFISEGTRGMVNIKAETGVGFINVYLEHGDQGPAYSESSNLFIDVGDEAQLEDIYATADGSIDLDLSRLELTGDRYLQVEAPVGPITVVVPDGISYRLRAHSDVGVITFFGEQMASGGSVRVDSIVGGGVPVLELEIYSSEGDIDVMTEGERS